MSKLSIRLGDFFRRPQSDAAPVVVVNQTTAPASAAEAQNPPTGEKKASEEAEAPARTGGPGEKKSAEGQTTTGSAKEAAPAAAAGATTPESTEPVETVEMTSAEFDSLKADAVEWRKNKAELETLRAWKQAQDGSTKVKGDDGTTKKAGATSGLSAEDQRAADRYAELKAKHPSLMADL